MSPFNAAICTTTYLERQKCYSPDKKILFKKQLFDRKVKGQGPMKVITVRGTPPYGHAPIYQISLTYLERQKCYGPEKKILFKKNYLTLRSKIKASRRSLRYATHCLMVMYPHTNSILSKKQLFDLEVKGQGPTKVIVVRETPPYGHAPTYQIPLTYFERPKYYDPDKKILFKKQLFDLEVKGQSPMKVITVRDTLSYGHVPTYQINII